MEEDTKTKKTESRKFVIWLVWLIIAVLLIIGCTLIMALNKQTSAEMIDLIKQVLTWFFAISMMYMGCNVGQKVGLAIFDKKDSEIKEEESANPYQ